MNAIHLCISSMESNEISISIKADFFLLFAFTFYGIIRLGNYIIFNFSSMFFLKTKLLDSRFVTQPRRETH